jgi:hypothetical protein
MNNDFTDSRLNRLIDGELSPTEYRAFLATLDDEPGSWRRCALALLESQAFGHELSDLRRSLDRPQTIPATNPVASARPTGLSPQSLLAIAASFLIAFTLGLYAPQFFLGRSKDSRLAGNFNMQPMGNESVSANDNTALPRNIGNLQLVVDNEGGSESRQVPVYEVERDPNDLLTTTAPPIGPEVLDVLRRLGYDVQHQEQLLPAELEDGRQMIVPLDGYQITPVSRRY